MLFLQGDFHLLAARNVDGYRQYTGDGAGIIAERHCKCFQPDMSAIQTFAAELQSAVFAGKSAGMDDVEAGTVHRQQIAFNIQCLHTQRCGINDGTQIALTLGKGSGALAYQSPCMHQ